MNDERQEELAALYALDLLEGAERAQFERDLARDSALQTLVRQFRESSAALAHSAPSALPPEELKTRILTSVAPAASKSKLETPNSRLFPFPVVPWAVAACFAVLAAWLAQAYVSGRREAQVLRVQAEIADVALETARRQLEAERLVNSRFVVDVERQRAENAGRLAAREQELASARDQIAALDRELKSQSDLAGLKIAALASMLNHSPEALAIAVWDPARQEGVLEVENLPALAAGEDYQLWVVDPQYPDPVDAGVFGVDPDTGEARVRFQPRQPIRAVNAFAVTRERKGGVRKAEGPFVLLGRDP